MTTAGKPDRRGLALLVCLLRTLHECWGCYVASNWCRNGGAGARILAHASKHAHGIALVTLSLAASCRGCTRERHAACLGVLR